MMYLDPKSLNIYFSMTDLFFEELKKEGTMLEEHCGYITEEPTLIWVYPTHLSLSEIYLKEKKKLPLHKNLLECLENDIISLVGPDDEETKLDLISGFENFEKYPRHVQLSQLFHFCFGFMNINEKNHSVPLFEVDV